MLAMSWFIKQVVIIEPEVKVCHNQTHSLFCECIEMDLQPVHNSDLARHKRKTSFAKF